MKSILLHGLGQTSSSWDNTVQAIGKGADVLCPDLFTLPRDGEVCYTTLYDAFCEYCKQFLEPIHLCGLSLGGILVLQYGIEHPERVCSLALIATQYVMPKRLLKVQNFLFRWMPNRAFQSMGLNKREWIQLAASMMDLDFQNNLKKIACPVLIICGEKDKANKHASLQLQAQLPHAELRIIAHAGHEVNLDVPEVLGKALFAFWRQQAIRQSLDGL